jgi:hypothetical protein
MTAEEEKPGTQSTEAQEALERFVVENDDLLTLESRIGRFNIFDALGITRAEIRHSNFLAFILDPAESHGQGQLFLKALLMDLFKNAPPERRPLSPIDLDGTDMRGVEIRREWKHIDLLIVCQEPRFFVVIENKIRSKEGRDQLSKYEKAMQEHYPDAQPLYVYLTLNADEPSKNAWVPYSHAGIHRVLTRVRETYGNAIGDDVLVFLDHYLNLLGTRFMNDEKIDELCRRIYKNHRQALDLIWERVGTPTSAVLAEVREVLDDDDRWHVFSQRSSRLDFVPATWLGWLPPWGLKENPHGWIMVRLRSRERRLDYIVLVGPMKEAAKAKREEIVKWLRGKSSSYGFKQSRAGEIISDKWSRISAAEVVPVEWGEDDDPETEAIQGAVKKTLDDLSPKLEKLASDLKELLCRLPASAT